jgi:tyrosyl-tRNA synthetase
VSSVFDTLRERGFVSQCSSEETLAKLLDTEQVTFYIGFDPTAKSLQVGNLVAAFGLAHFPRPFGQDVGERGDRNTIHAGKAHGMDVGHASGANEADAERHVRPPPRCW